MTEEKTIVEINDLINDYTESGERYSLPDLLNTQDKLSGYSYRFAEIVAKAKAEYNFGYLKRKIVINRATQSLIDLKIEKAVNKCQLKAETQNEDLLKSELTLEALSYEYDLKLKQLNRVLSSMQQRISFSKKEWELSQFQTSN